MKILTPFQDKLPMPAILDFTKKGKTHATIKMQDGEMQLHKDLPKTKIWGYNGTYPGPTIEAEQGKQIQIEWKNILPQSSYPATVVIGENFTQAEPGTGKKKPTDMSALPVPP